MTLSPQKKPVAHSKKLKKKKGLVIVYTGDGKGKTTAALGTALRAAGHGMKVAVIQFLKGNWKTGEMTSVRQLKTPIEIQAMGEGFTWDTKDPARDRKVAEKAWGFCKRQMLSGKYDVLVFDEINYALHYDYLSLSDVLAALKSKPKELHLILTGRYAPPQLIAAADLVTEMREIKHPFEREGLSGQKGIEF